MKQYLMPSYGEIMKHALTCKAIGAEVCSSVWCEFVLVKVNMNQLGVILYLNMYVCKFEPIQHVFRQKAFCKESILFHSYTLFYSLQRGQGIFIAINYTHVFSGDPDKRVISFVRSISPHEKACYHHIEFPSYKGVEVEVHYRPSFLLCFWHNRKLQKYYERVKEEQFSHRVMLGAKGEIAIPTAEFNLIFQLTHIYAHLMNEGIGLRQLVDYFFLLKNTDFGGNTDGDGFLLNTDCTDKVGGNAESGGSLVNTDFTDDTDRIGGNADGDGLLLNTDFTDNTDRIGGNADGVDRRLLQDELRRLGLWEFAGAVMYIMKEVFGLEDNRLIVPPDVKRGRLVLKEVLEAGNFGRYDKRNWFGHSALGHNLQRLYRDMRLVRYFPEEALSEPFFRIWHFFWRKRIVR